MTFVTTAAKMLCIYKNAYNYCSKNVMYLQKCVLLLKNRETGIKSIIYLDDGFNGSSTYNNCKECTGTVLHHLKCAGFTTKEEEN